jgi:hypothetical protein
MALPLHATRAQVRTLSALILLLIILVFWSGRHQLLALFTPERAVSTGLLEVMIPRGWQIRTGETSIDAWRTPVSVFSAGQVTSITVSSMKERLDGEILTEDEWRESITAAFGKQGHREYVERSFVGRSGRVLCLEASIRRPSHTTVSSCFVNDDSLLGVFDGNVEHLSTFYDVMKTCTKRSASRPEP